MSRFSALVSLIALFGLCAGCFPRGAANLQTRPNLRQFVKPETADHVSWKMVSVVFEKRCTGCHGTKGGVSLETYEAARAHRAEIDSAVFAKQSMPPRGKKMTTQELEILAAWLDMGAPNAPRKPEAAEPAPPTPVPPTPTPTEPLPPTDPPPTPAPPTPAPPTPVPPPPGALQPTFDSIMRLIVKPRCLECHTLAGEADGYPMDALADWLDPENRIVIPGDPANSKFIRSVSPSARKIMPPKKSGQKQLTPEEIEIIATWIRQGAKD